MKIALHVCCAVCAAGAVERLISEGHQVTGYFYNPNIHPIAEYIKRKDNAYRVSRELGFRLVEGDYHLDEWFQAVSTLENEPEGGKRCLVCFRFRLERTFRFMQDSGCDVFTTTLTMGSNKPAEIISREAEKIGGDRFLIRDFKKKEGFRRAIELARRWSLYRQNYCGCQFSLRKPSEIP